MNITFLVGNGFDLNLGLKTKFKDFIDVYKSETSLKSSKEDEILRYFKKIISSNDDLWSNAELAFGQLTEEFKNGGKNAEDFSICHEDFCVKLAQYLSEQEKYIDFNNLKDITSKAFNGALQGYCNSFREAEKVQIKSSYEKIQEEYRYQFINFNYTDTLEKCISALKDSGINLGKRQFGAYNYSNSLGELINVHGTISRDMVLGVADKSQIAMPSLFDGYGSEYINQIIKSEIDKDNKQNTYNKAFKILNSSSLIYIYGMSIGATDRQWWDKICTLMHNNQKLNIIIHRFDAPKAAIIRRRYTTFENQVRDQFLSFSNLDNNLKDTIRGRIHIDGSNIFSGLVNLVERSKNAGEKELKIASMQ